MQCLDAITAPDESLREFIDLDARATEDDREGRALKIKHTSERGNLVRARHDVGCLTHLWRGTVRACVARNQDANRRLEVTLGDPGNARRECC